jgi:hypothetical protein
MRNIEIGVVDVDAGLIMIGDPCYVLPDNAPRRPLVQDWTRFCEMVSDQQVAQPVGDRCGLVIRPPDGDGEYPVTAEVSRSGRLLRVTIDFDPADDYCDVYC